MEEVQSPVAEATIPVQADEASLAGETEQSSDTVENESTGTTADNTTQDEGSENDSDDTATEPEKKSKSGFEKRIERFNKKLSEKEAELDYWRKAAMGTSQVAPAQAEQPSEKPKFSDYNDLETYTEAVTDWKLQNAIKDMQAKQSAQTVATTYQSRVNEFIKTTPDFQAVVNDFQTEYGNSLPPEIYQTVMDSDVGPQMAYHLANNTDEVDRISALPAHRRLIELGKLEDRLSNTGVKETKKPPKVSKAPAPISKESGTAPVVKKLDDPNLSQSEYRQLRMANKRKY